MTVEFYFES